MVTKTAACPFVIRMEGPVHRKDRKGQIRAAGDYEDHSVVTNLWSLAVHLGQRDLVKQNSKVCSVLSPVSGGLEHMVS